MSTQQSLKIKLAVIWWVFTALIVAGVLFPIISKTDRYPFLWINILVIVVAVTLARYVFMLKFTFFAKNQKIKAVAAFLCIPLFLILINYINYVQGYIDERGTDGFLTEMGIPNKLELVKYIRSEILLFGVASVVSTVAFFFRMIISIWRYRNRGTV